MHEISWQTLVIAIQAVDKLIKEEQRHPAESAEDDLFLDGCFKAADELETAYAEATRLVSNSPPYSDLVTSPRRHHRQS